MAARPPVMRFSSLDPSSGPSSSIKGQVSSLLAGDATKGSKQLAGIEGVIWFIRGMERPENVLLRCRAPDRRSHHGERDARALRFATRRRVTRAEDGRVAPVSGTTSAPFVGLVAKLNAPLFATVRRCAVEQVPLLLAVSPLQRLSVSRSIVRLLNHVEDGFVV